MLSAVKKWAWEYSHEKKIFSGEKQQVYRKLDKKRPDLVLVMQITHHRNNSFSLTFKIPKEMEEHDAICKLLSGFFHQDRNHSRKKLLQWTYYASSKVSLRTLCNKMSYVQEFFGIQGDPLKIVLSDLVVNHLQALDLIDMDEQGPVVYLDKVYSVFNAPFSALRVNFSYRNLNELLNPRGIQVERTQKSRLSTNSDEKHDPVISPGYHAYRHKSGMSFTEERELTTLYDEVDESCTRCSIM